MALTVISQHFYKDNQLQFLSAVTSGGNYTSAFNEVSEYITDNGGSVANIDTINMFRLRNLQDASVGRKASYTVTVTFTRDPELPETETETREEKNNVIRTNDT